MSDGIVSLRRLDEDDVTETYLSWMNDPRVTRYMESRFVQHSMESLWYFVATKPVFGIFVGGEHVGNIKLDIDEHHRRGNIGILIGPEHWWKGYATKAIKLETEYAWFIGLHKVTASAYAKNIGSIRAFEKAGFVREAVLKDHWLVDGEYQDGILMAKVNGS